MRTLLTAFSILAVVGGLVALAWWDLRRIGLAAEKTARGPRDAPFPARVHPPEQDGISGA
jgi:hypothetical protein